MKTTEEELKIKVFTRDCDAVELDKNDKCEGICLNLSTGRVHTHQYYENDLLIKERFYEGGQIKSRMITRNGELYGRQNSWYENGQLSKSSNIKMDSLVSITKSWSEDGDLTCVCYLNNDCAYIANFSLKFNEKGELCVDQFRIIETFDLKEIKKIMNNVQKIIRVENKKIAKAKMKQDSRNILGIMGIIKAIKNKKSVSKDFN